MFSQNSTASPGLVYIQATIPVFKASYDATIDYGHRACQASNIQGSLTKPLLSTKMDDTLTRSRHIAVPSTSARHQYGDD